jgi:dolichyl-phosphooligosaccharide-protein glycotransferase
MPPPAILLEDPMRPSPHANPSVESPERAWIIPAAAVAAAFAARVIPYLHQVFGGRVVLYSDDPYYHVRRIALAARYWPRIPDFDSWISYPDGAWGIWAPLFDFIPSTVSRLTRLDPLQVAIFWPAVLGAMTAVPLYLLVRRLAGRRAATIAAGLFVFLPGAVLVGPLGRVDHHVAEVLLQLAVDASFLAYLLEPSPGRARTIRAGLWLGLLSGAALLTWAGSLLYLAVPAAVSAALAVSLRKETERVRDLGLAMALAFGVAAAMALPYGWLNFHRGRAPFSPNFLSFLQPVLCLAFGSAPWVAAAVSAAPAKGDRLSAGWRAALALASAAALLSLGPLRRGIVGGLAFVAARHTAWQQDISESLPLFSSAKVRAFGAMNLSWLVWLLPAAAVGACVLAAARRLRDPRSLFAAVWLVHVTALAFLQNRFVYYAAPAVCALYGMGIDRAWRRGRAAATAAALAAIVLLFPALAYWNPPLHPPYPKIDASLGNMLLYLGSVSPSPGDPMDPFARPAYGVLARWDLGYWVLQIAGRPVVATPFGPYIEGGGYEDSIRFFQQIQDEEQAVALIERRRCRYVITHAERQPAAAEDGWSRVFARRLQTANGSDVDGLAGSGRFRLMAETPQLYPVPGRTPARMGAFKIFELVPGAVLRVHAEEGGTVEARAAVGTASRSFEYVRRAVASADGVALIRVAYAGNYAIRAPGRPPETVRVTREAVDRGNTLR